MKILLEHLSREHAKIADLMHAFELYFEECKHQECACSEELQVVIDAASSQILQRYEEKEEECLLPELCRHGFSWSTGILGMARNECAHCRGLRRSVVDLSRQRGPWSKESMRQFSSIGNAWARANERHLISEKLNLFPLLRQQLAPRQEVELLLELEKIDRDYMSLPGAREMMEKVDRFVQHYAHPPRA
jgi:hemerythrin-like domain-containing protein